MSVFQTSDVVNRVTEALLHDPRTKGSLVDVSDQGGVVTLSGLVPSLAAKQAAEEDARQQDGVMSVINELAIQTGDGKDRPLNPILPR